MKIAIIAHSHHPIRQPFAGGMEAHTYHLTQSLKSEGHDVHLYACKGSDPDLVYHEFCMPTFEEYHYPTEARKAYRAQAYTNVMHEILMGGYDVVHNNSIHHVPLELSHILNCPMISVLHVPPFKKWVEALHTANMNDHHHTISISKFLDDLWKERIPNLKSSIVHNGIDAQYWKPSRSQAEPYAIWFGRICENKGTHLAIHAAKSAGMPVRIYGAIDDQQYFDKTISPLLKTHAPDIQYGGVLKSNILRKEIQNAAASLFTPCWEEPFGLVAIESLSCGVPVAGFSRGALPSILSPKVSVLVKKDINALAGALVKASYLSKHNCREFVLQNYTIDRMIDGYMNVYHNAIDHYVQNYDGCVQSHKKVA